MNPRATHIPASRFPISGGASACALGCRVTSAAHHCSVSSALVRTADTAVAHHGARRGFTMLEALLALVLMIVLLSGVVGFYMTTLQARKTGGTILVDATLARSLLDRITDEIRQATDIVPGDGVGFSGTHNKITIVRMTMPERYAFDKHDSVQADLPPAQLDMRRISYELIWDEELTDTEGVKICHGLLRSEQKTFDPNPTVVIKSAEATDGGTGEPAEGAGAGGEGGQGEGEDQGPASVMQIPVERELVAPEIKYLRFRYFDGAKWQDRWQNQQEQAGQASAGGDHAIPQAVEVTIGRVRVPPEEEESQIAQLKQMGEDAKKLFYHPDRFTTVVYLKEADQSLLSSRKYSSKNNEELQMGGEQP